MGCEGDRGKNGSSFSEISKVRKGMTAFGRKVTSSSLGPWNRNLEVASKVEGVGRQRSLELRTEDLLDTHT